MCAEGRLRLAFLLRICYDCYEVRDLQEFAQSRSEMFLKMYRVLEGALEKRYGASGICFPIIRMNLVNLS